MSDFLRGDDGKMVCGRSVLIPVLKSFSNDIHLKRNAYCSRVSSFGSLRFSPTYEDYRLRRALARVDAGPEGPNTVFWTSLREVGNVLLDFLLDLC
jgi:hypothetical protein